MRILQFALMALCSANVVASKTFIVCLGGWKSSDGIGWTKLVNKINQEKGYDIVAHNEKFSDKNRKDNTIISFDIPIETSSVDINRQAEVLEESLVKMGLEKDDNIILIGLSQAGLRSWAFLNKYNSKYNVRAIFTAGTPWKGANALNSADEADIWKDEIEEAVLDVIDSIPLVGLITRFLDIFHFRRGMDYFTDKIINKIAYENFAHDEGSKLMRPLKEGGIEKNEFLKNVHSAKSFEGGKKTYFGAFVGTNSDIFDTWLIDHEEIIGGIADMLEDMEAIADMLYKPFSWLPFTPERSSLAINIERLWTILQQESINVGWNGLITENRLDDGHDTLVPLYDQRIHPDVLDSIIGVRGEYIDGGEQEAHIYVDAGHTVLADENLSSEKILYSHPEVLEGMSEWIFKVLDEIEEEE